MPNLAILDALSLPGDPGRPNEDRFSHARNAVVVVDGATGLGPSVITGPGQSDAAWLAQFAAIAFEDMLGRGKSVTDARAILAFSTRDAAVPVRKVLESAAANADHNHGLKSDELVLTHVTVDPGPTIKRFRPRARGSASPILKRTSHITIGLAEPAAGAARKGR